MAGKKETRRVDVNSFGEILNKKTEAEMPNTRDLTRDELLSLRIL